MRLPDSGFPRFWYGILQPLLSGVGIMAIINWAVPAEFEVYAIVAVCLAVTPWLIRNYFWSKRMQKELEHDMAIWQERIKH